MRRTATSMTTNSDCDRHKWGWLYDHDSAGTKRRYIVHECADCGALRTLAYEDYGRGRLLYKTITGGA